LFYHHKCILSYYFISAESSNPSITIEPKLFCFDVSFSFTNRSRDFPQADNIINIKSICHRCRVVSLGQKKNNRINTYILVTQKKIEIYKYVTKSGIELTGYGHSLSGSTLDLYSPVNAFPYLLPCLQLVSMTAMG